MEEGRGGRVTTTLNDNIPPLAHMHPIAILDQDLLGGGPNIRDGIHAHPWVTQDRRRPVMVGAGGGPLEECVGFEEVAEVGCANTRP